jgi:hypothetical protein
MDATHAALLAWSVVNLLLVLCACVMVFRPVRRG